MFQFEELRRRCPPLSSGGFGSIYAYEPKKSNGKEWVVKEVHCKESHIESYIQEIVLSFNHNSPFILPTNGFNIVQNQDGKCVIRIKMPRMKGSLRDYIGNPNNKPFTIGEVAKLLYRLAYGLKQLQNVKISHRDMKPDNILLDKDNNALIADFGLGRLVVEETEYSQIGLAGTPGYFPPETIGVQKTKKKHLHKIDLWNLGITIYEACTFRDHFFKKELDRKPIDRQLQIVISKVTEKYGEKFGQIIAGLLNIDPEKRISFDNVCQLLEDNFSEHLQSTFDALTDNIRNSHRQIILDRLRQQPESTNFKEETKEPESDHFIFHIDKELTIKAKNSFELNSSVIQDLNKMLSKTLSKPSADSVKGLKMDFSWCESLDDNSLQAIDLKNITKKDIEELKLNIAGCSQITDKGLTCINQDNLRGLEKLESLVLDFSESNITKEGLEHVLDNIKDLSLKKLSIRALGSQIEIEPAEAQELANKIRQLGSLQLLRLDIPDILKSVKKDLKESLTYIKNIEVV